MHCDREYIEYVFKGKFIEGLQDSICQRTHLLFWFQEECAVAGLTSFCTSLKSLQNILRL